MNMFEAVRFNVAVSQLNLEVRVMEIAVLLHNWGL